MSDAQRPVTANALRREISARHRQRTDVCTHEVSFGRGESVLYDAAGAEGHGNFLPASFRRILADPAWARRLEKSYTGDSWMPRVNDRQRHELDTAASSDALLMNVFCYPGVLRRRALCACLGVAPGLRPDFGVRAGLPMRGGEVDRTEPDMALGDLFVEAKLTEGGFGRASQDRLLRYDGVEAAFALDDLPRVSGHFVGYQIIRGLLAAGLHGSRYLVLLDARRAELAEVCFQLRTWQEVAACLPKALRGFLAEKYGIEAVLGASDSMAAAQESLPQGLKPALQTSHKRHD